MTFTVNFKKTSTDFTGKTRTRYAPKMNSANGVYSKVNIHNQKSVVLTLDRHRPNQNPPDYMQYTF